MTTFDDRQKSFEKKFERDQDLQFKVNARKNKLLGLWAAELMGKSGAGAEGYAKEVVLADFEKPGDDDVIQKLVNDLANAGKPTGEQAIRKQAERLMAEAKTQLMADMK
ncbi:DUF1476 domain-containing protein [Reyranella soli]|uniref:Aldolase n=1 Tax=Reyranella soli TaxID=1230389 RepID=A0A512NI16_9HYPH|nr:DUF1476 domain-containing protein [Reyranella soli]GEP58603.1 hypothetical protein RSO01_57690 [Reyranella soli]